MEAVANQPPSDLYEQRAPTNPTQTGIPTGSQDPGVGVASLGGNAIGGHPAPVGATVTGVQNAATNQPQKLVEEFQYLLEKSQQLFNGLRDLPPIGNQKQWQPYFQKTFEIYTKLWKFQQHHRAVLESNEYYGLKRYEVGEIASKIGQLYYHYYLRTSETTYLQESYVFYEAMRDRGYLRDVLETKNPSWMIKKLRYYARFIVVCLLLVRKDIIHKLLEELSVAVEEYIRNYKPPDTTEWHVVLQEVLSFVETDRIVPLDTSTANMNAERRPPLPVRVRLQSNKLSVAAVDQKKNIKETKLRLQEAILIGSRQNQTKFSELTLDMYRMLQCLEREPGSGHGRAADNPSKTTNGNGDVGQENAGPEKSSAVYQTRRSNPRKYLLYRPTFSQIMVYLAMASKELNDNAALLLYISGDSARSAPQMPEALGGYEAGIETLARKDDPEPKMTKRLYPADLIPFSRKPLFVVIDSCKSGVFKSFQSVFNQPYMFLISPEETPLDLQDNECAGSIFTLFLHSPILAISVISSIKEVDHETWGNVQAIIDDLELRALEHLMPLEISFLQDDFLRAFLVRFVVSRWILMRHKAFEDPQCIPQSHPPIEIECPVDCTQQIARLVKLFNVGRFYSFRGVDVGYIPETMVGTKNDKATTLGEGTALPKE